MVQGQTHRLAHLPGAAQGTFQPGEMGHLKNGGDAAPFLAHDPRLQPPEFHLRRSIGAVAAFLLQPLQEQEIAAAIIPPALGEKAGGPGLRAGQRKKQIRHRHREEPFMAGERVPAAPGRA